MAVLLILKFDRQESVSEEGPIKGNRLGSQVESTPKTQKNEGQSKEKTKATNAEENEPKSIEAPKNATAWKSPLWWKSPPNCIINIVKFFERAKIYEDFIKKHEFLEDPKNYRCPKRKCC